MYKAIILFVVGVLVTQTAAQFKSDAFVCPNGTLLPGQALGAKLAACKDPAVIKDKDPRCVGHCVTESFGANVNGIPNRAAVSQVIKSQFPVAEQAGAESRIQKCFDDLGDNYDKAADTDCSMIAQYAKCGVQVVLQTKC